MTDVLDRIRGALVGLKMPRALEALDHTMQQLEKGEITAVVFAGKGWGHGVGLCQVGAYGMALRGATYRQILSHYYRGTRVLPQAQ